MKKYSFHPYDDLFPILFNQEKARLLAILPSVTVEHIGSTAIAGLGGKGIIDLLILAKEEEFDFVKEKLHKLGYEFRPQFSTNERLYFIVYLPDPKQERRRYHIHLTSFESPIAKELIFFRDYLRSHPDAKEEYAALKKKAISCGQEAEEYRRVKEPFINKILKAVREE